MDKALQDMAEHFRQNNDVGGKAYTEAEQQLIYEITIRLQQKRGVHKVTYKEKEGVPTPEVLPKHYMLMYAKAAAGIYEMAKALCSLSSTTLPGTVPIMNWIKIITGESFTPVELPEPKLEIEEVVEGEYYE